jgi:hypothetical protein
MANNCWYCRKGGIVDLYFAGRTGVCPICRSGVNVVINITIPPIEGITTPNREYKVGDRVVIEKSNIDGKTSNSGDLWNFSGRIGVIKDILDIDEHYKYFIKLDDGGSDNGACLYCDIKCFADDNPLTNEELMQMDGQRVWLSVLLSDGEHFKGYDSIGWFTVDTKTERLLDEDGGYYSMWSNGEKYGFRAYRTDQSHRANEDSEEEIPF